MCGMLFMMNLSMVFSSVLAIVEISGMTLYKVPKLFIIDVGMNMMLASFHMPDMMLVLRASVHDCV